MSGENKIYASHDLPEVGKDVAGLAAKNPQVVDAVYNRLTPDMQPDVARVLCDQLKPEDLQKLASTEAGKALLTRTRSLLDGKTTVTWIGKDFSKGDARRKNQIDAALNPQTVSTAPDVKIETAPPSASKVDQRTGPAASTPETPFAINPKEVKYTAQSLKRWYGPNTQYTKLDNWVNVIGIREGNLSDSKDIGDGGGLSVGIFQWTQNSGRLGELMQRYKDVAARDGKSDQFYQVFGGKETAENLLVRLKSNPTSISSKAITPLFAAAAKLDVFKKAQIEQAKADAPGYIKLVAPLLPYRSADGTASGKVLAAGLVVKNIGGAKNNASFVIRTLQRTTDGLFNQAVSQSPALNQELAARISNVKTQNSRLNNKELDALVNKETQRFKREIVEKTFSDKEFANAMVTTAPKILYTTPWKYAKYHGGVETRIRIAVESVPADKRVNPREF